ncbi:MAG: hypothetical protein DI556_08930 [Rhodovulum sulfidophilum]|uniref:ABC transporter substrate-binding protein n=1 Tax=Rhodovulum sulfidophilum TaxID=35806 RepID=A0A2W5ND57_RHOSU|nr:MAG: hypothetical protein DI556_08930 [Rhodovulum sulfidophilum]
MLHGRFSRRAFLAGGTAALFTPAIARRAYAARELTLGFNTSAVDAARTLLAEPFTEATGIPVTVVARRDNPVTEVKVQTGSGSYQWDVSGAISGDTYWQVRDLVEPLDPQDPAIAALPGYAREDGWVGYATVGYTMAYQTEDFPGRELNWEDLLDEAGSPGTRALRKRVNENVEIALRMSGVDPKDIYGVLATSEGWDRAFAKLDELKPVTDIWWDSDAQVLPLLGSGDLSICPNYNVDLYEVIDGGGKLSLNWDRGLMTSNGFLIPKGAPNADLARQFISFALAPERIGTFCARLSYGPTVPGAVDFVPADILPRLPTAPQNVDKIAAMDSRFWSENASQATQRFNEWLLR